MHNKKWLRDSNNIFTDAENNPHILLQQAITPHQNGTANILGQLYKVTNDYMFSQGDITETNGVDFLGLNECTKEEAISALQNYNTYKKQLTSIETLTNILQDTLNHLGISQDNAQEVGVNIFDVLNIPVKFTTDNLRVILNAFKITLDNAQEAGVKTFDVLKIPVKFTTDNLKIILEAFKITLDDISPTEIGKNILDLLSKPFTETTTSTTEKTNDNTNDGGTWGYVIGAVGFIAASLMVAKYGWDWYKGRNIKDENLYLINSNQQLKHTKLCYEFLKNDAVILNEVIRIKSLDDLIKLARSDEKYKPLIPKIQILNNEVIKLNSSFNIMSSSDSSPSILNKICVLLGGDDNLTTTKSFATLIATIRKENSVPDEEYKESITKLFEIFKVDEPSSGEGNYTNIDGQQDYTMPLLADGSLPSDSSGIGV